TVLKALSSAAYRVAQILLMPAPRGANSLPFFPTGDPSTWVSAPSKLSHSAPSHRARIENIEAGLHAPKEYPGPSRQGNLTDFVIPTRVGSQSQRRAESAASAAAANAASTTVS
ncbi:hypothetical protein DXG01_015091, partial [Tephrocybe rancida]